MKPITILRRKAKRGNQGFPLATLAYYGPDDKKATKAVLGIFLRDGDEPVLHRFFSTDKDVRYKIDVQHDILARLTEHEVRSLSLIEKILDVRMKKERIIQKARLARSARSGRVETDMPH
jgi:hypothetical protein